MSGWSNCFMVSSPLPTLTPWTWTSMARCWSAWQRKSTYWPVPIWSWIGSPCSRLCTSTKTVPTLLEEWSKVNPDWRPRWDPWSNSLDHFTVTNLHKKCWMSGDQWCVHLTAQWSKQWSTCPCSYQPPVQSRPKKDGNCGSMNSWLYGLPSQIRLLGKQNCSLCTHAWPFITLAGSTGLHMLNNFSLNSWLHFVFRWLMVSLESRSSLGWVKVDLFLSSPDGLCRLWVVRKDN